MTVVNNGFLKVYKKLDTYAFSGSLEAWIHRIVYRSIADHYRNTANRHSHTTLYNDFDRLAEENLLDQLYFQDLLNLARRLPPATYKVFSLHLLDGFKHNEIAEILNISVNTSKWHLAQAKKTLRQILKTNSHGHE